MSQMWTSPEVFENDLYEYSEIACVEGNEVTRPQSLIDWEARNNANQFHSVFDTPNLCEDLTYIVSGRGRGGISTIIKPGVGAQVSRNIDDDIKKKIREVTGLGFSNALIEQNYRPIPNNSTIIGASYPDVKPRSTSSMSSSSSTSNNSRSQSPVNISKKSTPSTTPKKSPSTASRYSSRVSVSPEPELEVVVEKKSVPIPLSAILKRAKDERKKPPEKAKTVDNIEKKGRGPKENAFVKNLNLCDIWRNTSSDNKSDFFNSWRRRDGDIPNRFFGCDRNKKSLSGNFNIGSNRDFPALK